MYKKEEEEPEYSKCIQHGQKRQFGFLSKRNRDEKIKESDRKRAAKCMEYSFSTMPI